MPLAPKIESPANKMSNHTNMSASSVPICQRVLERLESAHGITVSRVEEETFFDDYKHFSDAVKHLNLEREANHMVDLDDTSDWAMSGDTNTLGYLCVAFENADGTITLLREVCAKNKNGVPYVSHAWLPEYNFTKDSPVSLTEQEYFLQKRYYDGSLTKPRVFRYALEDDEEDEEFLPKRKEKEHPICVLCSKVCDCAYGHNPRPLKDEGVCCSECNQMVILARMGMLKKNAQGEFEFQRLAYRPTIGLIQPQKD